MKICQLFNNELMKTIHYPIANSTQALIWYYKNANGRNLFGHNGGDIGSSTEMFISISDNLGVVLLSNANNYNALVEIENAVFAFAEETDFVAVGDVNSDNVINILDIILIINIIIGLDNFNDFADINADGVIDVLDIVQLVNIILGS